jgi:hypothetical protein
MYVSMHQSKIHAAFHIPRFVVPNFIRVTNLSCLLHLAAFSWVGGWLILPINELGPKLISAEGFALDMEREAYKLAPKRKRKTTITS